MNMCFFASRYILLIDWYIKYIFLSLFLISCCPDKTKEFLAFWRNHFVTKSEDRIVLALNSLDLSLVSRIKISELQECGNLEYGTMILLWNLFFSDLLGLVHPSY